MDGPDPGCKMAEGYENEAESSLEPYVRDGDKHVYSVAKMFSDTDWGNSQFSLDEEESSAVSSTTLSQQKNSYSREITDGEAPCLRDINDNRTESLTRDVLSNNENGNLDITGRKLITTENIKQEQLTTEFHEQDSVTCTTLSEREIDKSLFSSVEFCSLTESAKHSLDDKKGFCANQLSICNEENDGVDEGSTDIKLTGMTFREACRANISNEISCPIPGTYSADGETLRQLLQLASLTADKPQKDQNRSIDPSEAPQKDSDYQKPKLRERKTNFKQFFDSDSSSSSSSSDDDDYVCEQDTDDASDDNSENEAVKRKESCLSETLKEKLKSSTLQRSAVEYGPQTNEDFNTSGNVCPSTFGNSVQPTAPVNKESCFSQTLKEKLKSSILQRSAVEYGPQTNGDFNTSGNGCPSTFGNSVEPTAPVNNATIQLIPTQIPVLIPCVLLNYQNNPGDKVMVNIDANTSVKQNQQNNRPLEIEKSNHQNPISNMQGGCQMKLNPVNVQLQKFLNKNAQQVQDNPLKSLLIKPPLNLNINPVLDKHPAQVVVQENCQIKQRITVSCEKDDTRGNSYPLNEKRNKEFQNTLASSSHNLMYSSVKSNTETNVSLRKCQEKRNIVSDKMIIYQEVQNSSASASPIQSSLHNSNTRKVQSYVSLLTGQERRNIAPDKMRIYMEIKNTSATSSHSSLHSSKTSQVEPPKSLPKGQKKTKIRSDKQKNQEINKTSASSSQKSTQRSEIKDVEPYTSLLKCQERKNTRTGKIRKYLEMKKDVNEEILKKFMEWNADLVCPVCMDIMADFSDWKTHFRGWNRCSAFFVDKEKCLFTCPPCEQKFSDFTDWSRHMFTGGQHVNLGHVAFPKGFLDKYFTSQNQTGGLTSSLEIDCSDSREGDENQGKNFGSSGEEPMATESSPVSQIDINEKNCTWVDTLTREEQNSALHSKVDGDTSDVHQVLTGQNRSSSPQTETEHTSSVSPVLENINQNKEREVSTNVDQSTSSVPQVSTNVDENTSSVPQVQTTVDRSTSSVPQVPTIVDENTSSVPQVPTNVAENTSSVPQVQTTVDRSTSSVPQVPTIVDENTSSVPQVPAAVDRNMSSVPQIPTTADQNTSSVPQILTTVDGDASSISQVPSNLDQPTRCVPKSSMPQISSNLDKATSVMQQGHENVDQGIDLVQENSSKCPAEVDVNESRTLPSLIPVQMEECPEKSVTVENKESASNVGSECETQVNEKHYNNKCSSPTRVDEDPDSVPSTSTTPQSEANGNGQTCVQEKRLLLEHHSEVLNQDSADVQNCTGVRNRKLGKKLMNIGLEFRVGFQCKLCTSSKAGSIFEMGAVAHVYNFHLNPASFKCKKCGKIFPTAWQCRGHMKKCSGSQKIPTEKETCHICGKLIADLKTHVKTHTVNQTPCSICGKPIMPHRMMRHVKRVHGERKVTQCEVCGVKVKNIKKHMRIHLTTLEDRQKVCKICGAKVVGLGLHMQSHKERKYTCAICDKKFVTKTHLRNHILGVHENIRPYVCKVCGYAFVFPHHLAHHLNTVHANLDKNKKKANDKNVNKDSEEIRTSGKKRKHRSNKGQEDQSKGKNVKNGQKKSRTDINNASGSHLKETRIPSAKKRVRNDDKNKLDEGKICRNLRSRNKNRR